MKKYLMSLAAIALVGSAFVGCSKNDDLYNPSQAQVDQAKYEQAFLAYVNGKIASSQDWGFSTTRGNAGEDYPATSTGINANANEWADPDKEFGGWLVPDALTDGQKERVRAYFQANPNLDNYDPQWRHFFVQQVYTGGDNPASTSTETITGADGTVYESGEMNELSVGVNMQHINNFNAASYGASGTNANADGSVNVLNNGQHVGGASHSDQIMLMVNIDDTSCFGYKESGASTQHNDKWALVSAATIDAWASTHGNPGEAVTDKWNRSFMGFDHALREGADAYMKNDAGEIMKVDYNQIEPKSEYAWNGSEIVSFPWDNYNEYIKKGDEYIGWLDANKNFYAVEDKITLVAEYNASEKPIEEIPEDVLKTTLVLKDVKKEGVQNNKTHVINIALIQKLVDDGYVPVNSKNMREWVKLGKSDGYFTDWIVTLCEAQRIGEQYDLRIIAEDLTATQGSDFDFNDVVIDVKYGNPATLRLMAAGGTLPLRINGDDTQEVHKLFGVWPADYQLGMGDKTDANPNPTLLPMVNTGAGPQKEPVVLTISKNIQNAAQANDLKLEVYKNGEWVEMKAPKGEPACKLAVTPSYVILPEYQSIKGAYPLFVEWVNENDPNLSVWWE